MQNFETISDVIDEYIVPALGTYADDYDLEAIAHDIAVTGGRHITVDVDEATFWSAVAAHDLTTD